MTAIKRFVNNEDGLYEQSDIKAINGTIESVVIKVFKVELETIFS